jgi:hypothetical protein
MLRALVLATLAFLIRDAALVQTLNVLHIKVVLVDAEGKATPVPRHVLLVSDNPTSAPPRRIVTALDGTADVRLRPGNYTVESDRPVVLQGKAYQWTQMVDVVAGRDTVLDLTEANAEVGPVGSDTIAAAPLEADPSSLLTQWQDSVVAIWTPTTHASGFVFDLKGLIATSQRVIGTATSVEVQLTPLIKVAAQVVAADAKRDVAILRVNPAALAAVRPIPLACEQPGKPVAQGQPVFTIETPLRGPTRLESGTIRRLWAGDIVADLLIAGGSAGGPVFTAGGDLIGLTTPPQARDEDTTVVRREHACEVLASAASRIDSTPPPDGTHLPVEPPRPFPVDALKEAAERRAGSLRPYPMTSDDFDIAFITPVMTYGAEYLAEQVRRSRGRGTRPAALEPPSERLLMDFSNWSDYVGDFPPVLLVRVTPKLVEGFWTTVGRFAARTQGVDLPPFKRFKSGFSRMRAFCGDAEVTPIHPFKLEHRVSENDSIHEGLYAFDPGALGPHCATVKLVLFSEKEPEKGDSRVVDPKVVEQVWQDFAPYRAPK